MLQGKWKFWIFAVVFVTRSDSLGDPHVKRPGGDFAYERLGIFVGNFELTSQRRPIMAWPGNFWPLKETIFKAYLYRYFFLTWNPERNLHGHIWATCDGVFPRIPKVRPKSEIYTSKRDDECPTPFHMQVSSPSPPPAQVKRWRMLIENF